MDGNVVAAAGGALAGWKLASVFTASSGTEKYNDRTRQAYFDIVNAYTSNIAENIPNEWSVAVVERSKIKPEHIVTEENIKSLLRTYEIEKERFNCNESDEINRYKGMILACIINLTTVSLNRNEKGNTFKSMTGQIPVKIRPDGPEMMLVTELADAVLEDNLQKRDDSTNQKHDHVEERILYLETINTGQIAESERNNNANIFTTITECIKCLKAINFYLKKRMLESFLTDHLREIQNQSIKLFSETIKIIYSFLDGHEGDFTPNEFKSKMKNRQLEQILYLTLKELKVSMNTSAPSYNSEYVTRERLKNIKENILSSFPVKQTKEIHPSQCKNRGIKKSIPKTIRGDTEEKKNEFIDKIKGILMEACNVYYYSKIIKDLQNSIGKLGYYWAVIDENGNKSLRTVMEIIHKAHKKIITETHALINNLKTKSAEVYKNKYKETNIGVKTPIDEAVSKVDKILKEKKRSIANKQIVDLQRLYESTIKCMQLSSSQVHAHDIAALKKALKATYHQAPNSATTESLQKVNMQLIATQDGRLLMTISDILATKNLNSSFVHNASQERKWKSTICKNVHNNVIKPHTWALKRPGWWAWLFSVKNNDDFLKKFNRLNAFVRTMENSSFEKKSIGYKIFEFIIYQLTTKIIKEHLYNRKFAIRGTNEKDVDVTYETKNGKVTIYFGEQGSLEHGLDGVSTKALSFFKRRAQRTEEASNLQRETNMKQHTINMERKKKISADNKTIQAQEQNIRRQEELLQRLSTHTQAGAA